MKDLIELITEGLEPASEEEIEQSRGEMLKELKESIEEDEDWSEVELNHRPGGHGFHSALHTIQLFMDDIERHVMGNPAVALDADAYRAAFRAHEALAQSFQELASIALEEAMGAMGEGGEEPQRS